MPPPDTRRAEASTTSAHPQNDHQATGSIHNDTDADRQREARSLTNKIKTTVEQLWELITEAYRSGAWTTLGYSTWVDYCAEEFGTDRIKIPTADRPAVVSLMSDAGMSLREIAAAIGLSKDTVSRSTSVSNETEDDLDAANVVDMSSGQPIAEATPNQPISEAERHWQEGMIALGTALTQLHYVTMRYPAKRLTDEQREEFGHEIWLIKREAKKLSDRYPFLAGDDE